MCVGADPVIVESELERITVTLGVDAWRERDAVLACGRVARGRRGWGEGRVE